MCGVCVCYVVCLCVWCICLVCVCVVCVCDVVWCVYGVVWCGVCMVCCVCMCGMCLCVCVEVGAHRMTLTWRPFYYRDLVIKLMWSGSEAPKTKLTSSSLQPIELQAS